MSATRRKRQKYTRQIKQLRRLLAESQEQALQYESAYMQAQSRVQSQPYIIAAVDRQSHTESTSGSPDDQQRTQLVETLVYGDYLTPLLDRFQEYRQFPDFYPPWESLSNHTWGANWPFWRTEQELSFLRTLSRIVTTSNSNGVGLLNGLTSYVVGRGSTIRVTSKGDASDDARDIAAAQDVIDDTIRANNWKQLERELFQSSRRYGEFILRAFFLPDGTTVFRRAWSEQLRQPPSSNIEEWSFGVQTDPADLQTVHAYWLASVHDPGEGEEVSADEILHFKRNVESGVKRGQPDFCWDVREALELARKLRRNLGVGSANQASISWIEQFPANVSPTAIKHIGQQRRDLTTPRWSFEGDRTNEMEQRDPGEIIRIPEGREYVPAPQYSAADKFIDVAQHLLRAAGNRWNAPEWLGSSNSQETNYASSLTAESPFVKWGEAEQEDYSDAYRTLFTAVLKHAERSGRLLPGTTGRIELQIEPAPMTVRDPDKEAQRHKTYLELKIASPQTVSQEAGYDFENEQTNIEAYQAKHGPEGGAGLPGEEEQPGEQDGQGNPADVLARAMSESTLVEEFREHEHPRGEGGKFTSGAGSTSTKDEKSQSRWQRKDDTKHGLPMWQHSESKDIRYQVNEPHASLDTRDHGADDDGSWIINALKDFSPGRETTEEGLDRQNQFIDQMIEHIKEMPEGSKKHLAGSLLRDARSRIGRTRANFSMSGEFDSAAHKLVAERIANEIGDVFHEGGFDADTLSRMSWSESNSLWDSHSHKLIELINRAKGGLNEEEYEKIKPLLESASERMKAAGEALGEARQLRILRKSEASEQNKGGILSTREFAVTEFGRQVSGFQSVEGAYENIKVEIEGRNVEENLKTVFGADYDFSRLGLLCNAVSDGQVSVKVREDDQIIELDMNFRGGGAYARRYLEYNKRTGKLTCYNNYFTIDHDSPNKGSGSTILARQVDELSRVGCRQLSCMAAGSAFQTKLASRKGERADYNGYYTWPRLGYDGYIPTKTFRKFPEHVQKALEGKRRLFELFSLPEGKDLWKQHGVSIEKATFDTTPGSKSIQRLNEYLEERGVDFRVGEESLATTKAESVQNTSDSLSGAAMAHEQDQEYPLNLDYHAPTQNKPLPAEQLSDFDDDELVPDGGWGGGVAESVQWEEHKHPRGEGGKFTSGAGGGSSGKSDSDDGPESDSDPDDTSEKQKPKPKRQMAARGKARDDALRAVRSILSMHTAGEFRQGDHGSLAKLLPRLTVAQLKGIRKQLGAKGGKLKADIINRITGALKPKKTEGGEVSDPVPQLAQMGHLAKKGYANLSDAEKAQVKSFAKQHSDVVELMRDAQKEKKQPKQSEQQGKGDHTAIAKSIQARMDDLHSHVMGITAGEIPSLIQQSFGDLSLEELKTYPSTRDARSKRQALKTLEQRLANHHYTSHNTANILPPPQGEPGYQEQVDSAKEQWVDSRDDLTTPVDHKGQEEPSPVVGVANTIQKDAASATGEYRDLLNQVIINSNMDEEGFVDRLTSSNKEQQDDAFEKLASELVFAHKDAGTPETEGRFTEMLKAVGAMPKGLDGEDWDGDPTVKPGWEIPSRAGHTVQISSATGMTTPDQDRGKYESDPYIQSLLKTDGGKRQFEAEMNPITSDDPLPKQEPTPLQRSPLALQHGISAEAAEELAKAPEEKHREIVKSAFDEWAKNKTGSVSARDIPPQYIREFMPRHSGENHPQATGNSEQMQDTDQPSSGPREPDQSGDAHRSRVQRMGNLKNRADPKGANIDQIKGDLGKFLDSLHDEELKDLAGSIQGNRPKTTDSARRMISDHVFESERARVNPAVWEHGDRAKEFMDSTFSKEGRSEREVDQFMRSLGTLTGDDYRALLEHLEQTPDRKARRSAKAAQEQLWLLLTEAGRARAGNAV